MGKTDQVSSPVDDSVIVPSFLIDELDENPREEDRAICRQFMPRAEADAAAKRFSAGLFND